MNPDDNTLETYDVDAADGRPYSDTEAVHVMIGNQAEVLAPLLEIATNHTIDRINWQERTLRPVLSVMGDAVRNRLADQQEQLVAVDNDIEAFTKQRVANTITAIDPLIRMASYHDTSKTTVCDPPMDYPFIGIYVNVGRMKVAFEDIDSLKRHTYWIEQGYCLDSCWELRERDKAIEYVNDYRMEIIAHNCGTPIPQPSSGTTVETVPTQPTVPTPPFWGVYYRE